MRLKVGIAGHSAIADLALSVVQATGRASYCGRPAQAWRENGPTLKLLFANWWRSWQDRHETALAAQQVHAIGFPRLERVQPSEPQLFSGFFLVLLCGVTRE